MTKVDKKASLQQRAHYAKIVNGISPLQVQMERMRYHYKRFLRMKDALPDNVLFSQSAKPEIQAKLIEIVKELDWAGTAAALAAPYKHPRLASLEVKQSLDLSNLTNEEVEVVTRILAKARSVAAIVPEENERPTKQLN